MNLKLKLRIVHDRVSISQSVFERCVHEFNDKVGTDEYRKYYRKKEEVREQWYKAIDNKMLVEQEINTRMEMIKESMYNE